MNKAFDFFVWEDFPSINTVIDQKNLNKVNRGLEEVDNRVITHEEVKATKVEVAPLIKEISFNESNGIFTITRKDGSSFIIDTKLEKIAINFGYDPLTQQITLNLIDGTKQYIDLSALITQYEFLDTETVSFFVDESGKVYAIVKEGSVQEKHLRPNYLAEIKVEAAKAQQAAAAAANAETIAGAKATESSDYATQSKSWAVGGTGVRPDENVNNSKYFAEETKKLLEEASDNVNPTKYSVNQKKQVTLSTLQRVTIKDEYTNSGIAGVSFYLDLDSFSFQNDYLYTEPDNGQPLEDFYDENDSNYSFSMNVVKYYIYVCNKDTGNVLDSMSVDIDPYYYSGGAEEFLSDIASNYYFYDKTKQDYVESSVAPSGVNTYYETSGYVYAYANSSSLLNNILIHDTAADIIFSGLNRVYGSSSGSTISASSLKSLVDYMGSSDSKKGIVFIVFRNYGSANSFMLVGYYETNVLILMGDVYITTLETIILAINRNDNSYATSGILDNRYIDVKTIGIIRI